MSESTQEQIVPKCPYNALDGKLQPCIGGECSKFAVMTRDGERVGGCSDYWQTIALMDIKATLHNLSKASEG